MIVYHFSAGGANGSEPTGPIPNFDHGKFLSQADMAASHSRTESNGSPLDKLSDHSDMDDVNMNDLEHDNASIHSDDNLSDGLVDHSEDISMETSYGNHSSTNNTHNDSDLVNGNETEIQVST